MIVFVMRKARATQLTIELTFKGIDLQSIHGDRYYNPNPPQGWFVAVFRIHDILVWIRIRIRGP
jgi:hypothetical protein